jgi:hypothetical protein
MILLHRTARIPLFILAGLAFVASVGILGLAGANGYPFALLWRGILAFVVSVVALWLGWRRVAPATPRGAGRAGASSDQAR